MKKRFLLFLSIALVVLITLALGAMKRWDYLPYIMISGSVIDENGNPIENATVAAHFGLTYDAPITTTGSNGRFSTSVYALKLDNSGKGPPSIAVSKQGYREYRGYFNKIKSGGLIFRSVTVKLERGPEGLLVKEEL